MKCWKSEFNAQDSTVIILGLQVRAVKIYAATAEALKQNERQGSTQKLSYPHPWMLMVFFLWISSYLGSNWGF
jgi:hypothetical protein